MSNQVYSNMVGSAQLSATGVYPEPEEVQRQREKYEREAYERRLMEVRAAALSAAINILGSGSGSVDTALREAEKIAEWLAIKPRLN